MAKKEKELNPYDLNHLFKNTEPLTGELLQHLSDYFDKTAKSKPILPNRL